MLETFTTAHSPISLIDHTLIREPAALGLALSLPFRFLLPNNLCHLIHKASSSTVVDREAFDPVRARLGP